MELTVIVPTRDRRPILCETLARLETQLGDVSFEVIVVDDGSEDGTAGAVTERAPALSFPLTVLEQPAAGPGAARNRAMAAARGPVCLFLNDDSWPRRELLVRHRDFHRRRPERDAALLGRMDLPPQPRPTPFMCWLAGVKFDYTGVVGDGNAGGERFFTANVSAKTAFLQSVGGFDEGFRLAHEDTEIGLRLQAAGMQLVYDPDAVVEHQHPMDLPTAIDRMHCVGRSLALLAERHPEYPVPRRPGMRHRVKAGALTCLTAAGVRTARVQRETWRFLCHEASREEYWSAVDTGDCDQTPPDASLRIGRTLARLASRDEDARMPSAGRSAG